MNYFPSKLISLYNNRIKSFFLNKVSFLLDVWIKMWSKKKFLDKGHFLHALNLVIVYSF